jgi:hypothetical protein
MTIFASLTFVWALLQPHLADAANIEPMNGWQQLGVCGGCFAIMALQSVQNRRGTKDAAVEHRAGLDSLANEIGGLRTDIKENLEEQLSVLRNK